MADRQANFANNWASTLDAEMGPSALTATVASTTGAPSSPCYLVIDLDDDAKREYIWFDDAFTATDFVTTSTGNRYLSGSAAGSGITHAVGASIIAVTAAQALEDLHDRIDGVAGDVATLDSAFGGHSHDSSGPGAILQYDEHKLTANESMTGTLAVIFDGDLACTFAAPASGNVLVTVTANVQAEDSVAVVLALTLDGSTEAQTSEQRVKYNEQLAQAMICYRKKLTGLSGSTTVELMARAVGGSGSVVGTSGSGFESYVTMLVQELA